jgi:outer membrane protein assembly factor BamD (BamD/ComL family)
MNPRAGNSRSPVTLVVFLLILAAVVLSIGLVLGIAALVVASQTAALTPLLVLAAVSCMILGLAVACSLWALSWALRRLHEVWLFQRRVPMAIEPAAMALRVLAGEVAPEASPSSPPAPVPAGHSPDGALQQLLTELHEIKRNTLLSESQRQIKRLQHQTRTAEDLAAQAEQAIDAGDFASAQAAVQRLADEVPDDPRIESARRRLSEARSVLDAEDVQQGLRQAEDYMAVASFALATNVAEDLLARHPDSQDATALLERIRREASNFYTEQRRRMYRQVEHHVTNRRWRQAVEAAEQYLEAYPAGPEAELVRTQLPTMQDNAKIEEVRDMRDRIRDYLERRRYLEAVELARELVERFPHTAAAEELRSQLPRLTELARGSPSGRP